MDISSLLPLLMSAGGNKDTASLLSALTKDKTAEKTAEGDNGRDQMINSLLKNMDGGGGGNKTADLLKLMNLAGGLGNKKAATPPAGLSAIKYIAPSGILGKLVKFLGA